MTRPPFNLAAVERATVASMASGIRVFQTHYFRDTEHDQVAYLLDALDPPEGAMVLDAGCGIGEVSRLMSDMRPDLAFVLVNISPYQLALCPTGDRFLAMRGDCHALDINDGTLDAAMYSSTLCQLDETVALAEAHRVLKEGGVLLINDMARIADDGGALERAVAARVLNRAELIEAIEDAGFTITDIIEPQASDAHFRDMLEAGGMGHLIDGVYPIIIRAMKGRVTA